MPQTRSAAFNMIARFPVNLPLVFTALGASSA
jgi:hypothetical protein